MGSSAIMSVSSLGVPLWLLHADLPYSVGESSLLKEFSNFGHIAEGTVSYYLPMELELFVLVSATH